MQLTKENIITTLIELDNFSFNADMLTGLVIDGKNVGFALELPPELSSQAERYQAAAETAVKQLGAKKVTVITTAERTPPDTFSTKRGKPIQKIALPQIQHIVAVASGKGGVGKSTTTVNLAVALNQLGYKVGVLDADIYGPSIPKLLDLKTSKKPTRDDLKPQHKYGVHAMSIGLLVDVEQPTIWRGLMVMGAIEQLLKDVPWPKLDILLVDMPPGTGDAQLTLSQKVNLSGAIIVSTPQDLALIDARKGLKMFTQVGVPTLGLIENMSTFICPNCDHESHIFDHGGVAKEAKKLDLPLLGQIPLSLDLREASDAGKPVAYKQKNTVFHKIARNVADQLFSNQREVKQN